MDGHGPNVGNLVLVAALAFVVPLLLNRLKAIRIPTAAGEIVAGIIVGKSGLGIVHGDEVLQLFTFLGLASLMFLSGMEIDVGAIAGGGKRPAGRLGKLFHPLGVGAVIFLLSLWLTRQFAGALAARGLVSEPLFLTMIIATCGLTIIMPVLKDHHLLDKPFGQAVFNTAILGDIVPLLGLSVLVALRETGSAMQSLWIVVLLAAGVLVYFVGRWMSRYRLLEGLAHGTTQITVRAAFALMFVFLALAGAVGVEAILGAFVAGLLLSALAGPYREEITHKLDALGFGFLIPVFFFMVGIEFDLSSLLQDRQALMLVPLLLGGLVAVKALPAVILALWFPIRQTLAGMLLLTTQMSVTIAASSIALKVGAYGPSVHAAVVLAAILSAILGPVAFGRVIGQLAAEPVRRGYVLAGMNRLSLLLGERLAGRGEPVCAVDRHPERAAEFEAAGLQAKVDNPTNAAALRGASGETAAVLIAITEDEAANLAAARAGRSACEIPRAILFAWSAEVAAEARAEGFEVINPDMAEVNLVETLLHSPGAAELLTQGEDDLKLADVVLNGGPLVGVALRDAQLPARLLVVAVGRGAEKIVPHGSTVLQRGDRLTVVGPAEAVATLRRSSVQ